MKLSRGWGSLSTSCHVILINTNYYYYYHIVVSSITINVLYMTLRIATSTISITNFQSTVLLVLWFTAMFFKWFWAGWLVFAFRSFLGGGQGWGVEGCVQCVCVSTFYFFNSFSSSFFFGGGGEGGGQNIFRVWW